ncbi:MAG: extracellular solute-binding protein [Chloroflexi bacterium]|nr:extracellular solute-binding protein [Chloroflexota bacterium]
MKKALSVLVVVIVLLMVSGLAAAQTELSMWYHGGAWAAEHQVFIDLIEAFNSSQSEYAVILEAFPQESYNSSIVAAAAAGDLPDIIDVDGPVMPGWAWAGWMAPLTLSEGALDEFLPGPIGEWQGELYAVGLWDAAVSIYARRSVLEAHEIRIPTLEEPWTGDEFDAILEQLQASGEFEYAFDLGMAWTGEWYPYAFSPFLQSFGGDMIDRSTYCEAEGVLNGEAGVAFGEWWQSLFDRGLSPGTSQDTGDRETGFIDGRYALQWMGNWAGVSTLAEVGDDLIFLPAPDFGHGNIIGAASWQLGASATTEHPEGVSQFIEFAIQDEWLTAFSDATGLAPATANAAAMSENYSAGGPLEVFYELSNDQALIRPVTPGYATLALIFEKALADIANGADVQDSLDAAVDEIEADIEDNGGYGFDCG